MDETEIYRLRADRVEELFRFCLFEEDEDQSDGILVPGIVHDAKLHPGRVNESRGEIVAMLGELPEGFRRSAGGGWSFLAMCDDRHGEQWTGLHQTMELLCFLGIAAGAARWLLPREVWEALPGGMPYLTVLDGDW